MEDAIKAKGSLAVIQQVEYVLSDEIVLQSVSDAMYKLAERDPLRIHDIALEHQRLFQKIRKDEKESASLSDIAELLKLTVPETAQ